jgi:hypothetical protein
MTKQKKEQKDGQKRTILTFKITAMQKEYRVKFHNGDLQMDINGKLSFLWDEEEYILPEKNEALVDSEEPIWYIDLPDTGYQYANEKERDEDFDALCAHIDLKRQLKSIQ